MAKIIENPSGRRMVRLNVDDIFSVVAIFQQRCNAKTFTYDEARVALQESDNIYLPEEI